MTGDDRPGGPRYADEVTADAGWEIGDFLLSRLERAAGAHPAGSEEAITAAALAEAVAALVLNVEHAATGGKRGRARGPVGAVPPAPADSGTERRVRAEQRLERLREDWNLLCDLAGHWSSAPGYQGSRWCRIAFRDAERERWYRQQVADAEAVRRAVRPPQEG